MTIVIIIIVLAICGALLRTEHNLRDIEKRIIKTQNEIDWWNEQCNKLLKEREELRTEYDILKRENKWYIELIEKYQDRYWPFKLTIEKTYEEQIIKRFEEWLSNKQIANKIWCSKATIQRATKKLWLR